MANFVGDANDNVITLTLGNDMADGQGGIDTLVLDYGASNRTQYMSVSSNGDGGFNGNMSDMIADGYGWYSNFYNFEKFEVHTGSGSDTIDLRNVNSDLIISTGSNDDYVVTGRGANVIDFGTGTNGWSSDHSDATVDISVDFVNSTYSGPGSTSGSFSYTGYFYTGLGKDTIVTGQLAGSESWNTGSGNDILTVYRGNETVDGGDDSDTLVLDYSASNRTQNMSVSSNGAGGFNGNMSDLVADGYGWYANFYNFENFDVRTGSGSDTIDLRNVNSDLKISTGSNDDYVLTGHGANVIDFGTGTNGWSSDHSDATVNISVDFVNSTYSGPGSTAGSFAYTGYFYTGSGNDTIVSGTLTGTETWSTGAGNDSVTVYRGNENVDGGSDTDTLVLDYSDSTRTQQMAVSSNGAGGFNGNMSDLIGDANGWYANFYNFEKFDIRTGSGSDTVDLRNVNSDLKIATGSNDDYVLTGRGANVIDFGTGTNGWSSDHSDATVDIGANFVTSTYSGPGSTAGSFSYTGYFYTGSGNDTIVSGTTTGNETFGTGSGDDKVTLHRGNDNVDLGEGSDTLVLDYSASTRTQQMSVSSNGAGGFNGNMSDLIGDANGWYANFYNVEKFDVRTGTGDDYINLGNVNSDLKISSGAGSDYVVTGRGNNVIDFGSGTNGWSSDHSDATVDIAANFVTGTYSGPGSTTGGFSYAGYFYTGSGNDTIVSGTGLNNETFSSGEGNDSITLHRGNDTANAGAGVDTLVLDYAASSRTQVMSVSANGSGGFNGNISDYVGDGNGWYANFYDFEKFDVRTGSGADSINLSNVTYDVRISTGSNDDSVQGGSGNDTIEGGSGSNSLYGNGGTDTLSYAGAASGVTVSLALQDANQSTGIGTDYATGFENLAGSAHNDVLTGDSGNNTITGGDGHDQIQGGGGTDTLIGGLGNDDFRVGAGTSTIDGGDGIDRLILTSTEATYALTKLGDQHFGLVGGGVTLDLNKVEQVVFADKTINLTIINGGPGNDTLDGASGDDILNGLEGNDKLYGNEGNDLLDGGIGDDLLDGGNGTDTVSYAEAAAGVKVNLTVVKAQKTGGSGSDTVLRVENLVGSAFVDTLTGDDNANILRGGDGNDTLVGAAGADSLYGDAGNDKLNGGADADVMDGGDGNDSYTVDNVGDQVVEAANKGTDTVSTTLASYALGSEVENLTFIGSGDFIGTGNAQINALKGGAGNDLFYAGDNNDSLTGNAGNDELHGEGGNDKIDGGLGDDAMYGGAGNDSYVVDSIGDQVFENALEGTDTVSTKLSSYTLTNDVENLTFTGVGDFTGTGNASVNAIKGGTGNDWLYGGDGNDTLTGNDGSDHLFGGNDNDKLDGGLGDDVMTGGGGNDTYIVNSVSDQVVENDNEGTDAVTSSVTFTLSSFVEKLTLTGFDHLDGTGNAQANTVTGNGGNNDLYGLGGVDSLVGGDGSDWLFGGAGADTLTGGLGADTFVFDLLETSANKDTLKDFVSATDRIALDKSVFGAFSGHALGALSNADLSFGTAATTASQHLIYNTANGALYYDADGVGGTAQVQIATLSGHPALVGSDFFLI